MIFVSVGTTYALLDPGEKLANWYDRQFKEKVESLSASSTNGLLRSLENFKKELKDVTKNITEQLEEYKGTKTKEITNSIKQHQDLQLHQLHTVTEEINIQSKEQMKTYTEQKVQDETKQITKDIEDILANLTKEE